MNDNIELADVLTAALRSGIAHNNGAGGQYLLCATEQQLLKFAESLRARQAPAPVEVSRLGVLAHNVSEMCKGALRIPNMPWPDAGAHGLDAYCRAVHRSYCDLRFKLIDIMREAEAHLAASPAPAASKGAEASKLLHRFERALTYSVQLHTEYQGKCMPESVYDTFADVRDNKIPTLRAQLEAALAAPSEPEAQKAVAYSPEGVLQAASDYADQRVMATKGRAGPVEVAEALEHLREVVIAYGQVNGQISSPSPAASIEVQGQRYAEWLNLAKHGQWSNGIPDWARDQRGLMSDSTAMRAVIEELAALAAKNGWRLGEGQ